MQEPLSPRPRSRRTSPALYNDTVVDPSLDREETKRIITGPSESERVSAAMVAQNDSVRLRVTSR
jgi:hypothetical protein